MGVATSHLRCSVYWHTPVSSIRLREVTTTQVSPGVANKQTTVWGLPCMPPERGALERGDIARSPCTR